MSAKSELKIKLKAEGASQANQAIDGIKRGVENLSGSISAATRAIRLFSSAMMLYAIAERLVHWFQKAREETAKWASTMRDAAREADSLNLTASALDAIRQAAEEAGTPVDALDKALADYKNHTITFQELAEAIGSTAEAIEAIETASAPGRAGRDYLEKLGRTAEDKADREKEIKAERAGLRAITQTIRHGTSAEKEEAWDALLHAAGGDKDRAAELYNANKAWTDRFRVGETDIGGYKYGQRELDAASGRYQQRREEEAAARAARIAAHDAAVERRRQAEADKQAAREREAEEKRDAAQRAREAEAEARRKEQMEQRAEEKRANLQIKTAKEIDSITVDAPKAASSYGEMGGIMGTQITTAASLAAQREARKEVIMQEHTQLLSEINESLKD